MLPKLLLRDGSQQPAVFRDGYLSGLLGNDDRHGIGNFADAHAGPVSGSQLLAQLHIVGKGQVAGGGSHPVYRYAKALFVGV